jgi:flagellar motor switch protein FliG
MVTSDFTTAGGIESIVDILLSVDRGTEKHIMESLEMRDSELAEEIKRRMFVFEDIVTLDNRSVQRFLREVDNNDLALALKTASEEVKRVIFSNISKRLQDMLKEDMEFMGPVRLRDVEDAQQKIVNIIRRLEDAGEIVVSRGGGDEIIV